MENKFSWTQEFRRSWEDDLKEEKFSSTSLTKQTSRNRKNVIRHLHLVIDTSSAIEKPDYLPSIRSQLAKSIPSFVNSFTESNPLSVLTFMSCREVVEKYSKIFDLNVMLNTIGSGNFSFLNCLKGIIEVMKNTKHNRECLIIISSIGTRDNDTYEDVIAALKKFNIKISIISICGEVTLFKKIVSLTNGLFYVPQDFHHLNVILDYFCDPLDSNDLMNILIQYGFPARIEGLDLCSCHLKLSNNLYECPRCKTAICDIPSQCPICELQLVSPLNISKSYYHIYTLKQFLVSEGGVCKCCGKEGKKVCSDCKGIYCDECDRFVHEYLNFCILCPPTNHLLK